MSTPLDTTPQVRGFPMILEGEFPRKHFFNWMGMTGLDFQKFDDNSVLTLDDLWRQTTNFDVSLRLNLKTGKIYRRINSVRVLIIFPNGCILEQGRRPVSVKPTLTRETLDKLRRSRKRYSFSGSRKRVPSLVNPNQLVPENPVDTIIREGKEELGIDILPHMIRSVSTTDELDEHPSTVFSEIESQVLFRRYVCTLPAPPSWKRHRVEDNGMYVYSKVYSKIPSSVRAWMTVSAAMI